MCVRARVSVCLSVCLSSLVCMVEIIYVYVNTVFGFMGTFFNYCLVGCLSRIVWTPDVLGVLCMCFYIIVFAPGQRNSACFTWKGALEINVTTIII